MKQGAGWVGLGGFGWGGSGAASGCRAVEERRAEGSAPYPGQDEEDSEKRRLAGRARCPHRAVRLFEGHLNCRQ